MIAINSSYRNQIGDLLAVRQRLFGPHRRRMGSGGARILVSWFSDRRYAVQLPSRSRFVSATDCPHSVDEKRLDVLVTPSLWGFQTVLAAERHQRRGWARRFAPRRLCLLGSVSRWAEYPLPLRAWIKLGRRNNIEVTFPAESKKSLPRRTRQDLHPRAFTPLDAGRGKKVHRNSCGNFFAPCRAYKIASGDAVLIPTGGKKSAVGFPGLAGYRGAVPFACTRVRARHPLAKRSPASDPIRSRGQSLAAPLRSVPKLAGRARG